METKSKTERALIGTTAGGRFVILATDGRWIANDVENICDGAEDVGLVEPSDCPTPGLYLWEGSGQLENQNAWDEPPGYEAVYHGTVRPVKPEEVAELYAMMPPEPDEHVKAD